MLTRCEGERDGNWNGESKKFGHLDGPEWGIGWLGVVVSGN